MSPAPSQSQKDLPPPELIEDGAAFDRMLDALDGEREIAVDTEADSFFNYREKVCLIQVSAGGQDWLIDPLASFDLMPFGEVLADPERVKVFHDGEYDVLILKRDYGFQFDALFDTRVAAAALGSPSPGLASVLEEHFDVRLDKSMQRSDWSRRPLSAKQIAYARLDTRYLIELMHAQKLELEERDLSMVVEGECRRVAALESPERKFEPDEFARMKGARNLDPRGRRALRELFVWRDEQACRRDLPPFKVLSNNTLLALADQRPNGLRELGQVEGMGPRLLRSHGDQLLDVLDDADELEAIERLPRLPARDGTSGLGELAMEFHERLKTWRRTKSVKEGFDASLVLNRHVLLALAKERPRDVDELEDIVGIQDWQLDRYEDELLDLVEDFERDVKAGKVPAPKSRRRARR